MLVADGMGDWPLKELGGKTPLQEAWTPNMDLLASRSRVGVCQTIPDNMPPGSDIANMALMGYDPKKHHTGRGPIEAVAKGIETGPEDLVWRCNLVSLTGLESGAKMVDYSAGHIPTDKAGPLISGLQKELGSSEFTFHTGVQYRHLIVQKQGSRTRGSRVFIRPPHDILDQVIDPDLEMFRTYPPLWELVRASADILKRDGRDVRADSIWPWGQGKTLSLPVFRSRFGISGAVISAVDLIKGLGRAAGLAAPDVPGATGLVDTNYQAKVQAARDVLEKEDFVFVHLEGPDECGHMGHIADKVEAIARFDRLIVGPLLEFLRGRDYIMVICCDHLTPIKIRTHARDPVPFLVYDSKKELEGPEVFSEVQAARTGLTIEKGHDLLAFALE